MFEGRRTQELEKSAETVRKMRSSRVHYVMGGGGLGKKLRHLGNGRQYLERDAFQL